MSSFNARLRNCRNEPNREERTQCFQEVNDDIVDELTDRHGRAGRTCSETRAEHAMFGKFLHETLDITGHNLNDIEDMDTICRGGANIVEVNLEDTESNDLFIKLGGRTAKTLSPTEIHNTQEADRIAAAINEDTPAVINTDPVKGVMAVQEIDGVQVCEEPNFCDRDVDEPERFTDAPAPEIADSLLFSAMVASDDRWNNVFRDGDIIQHIDFDNYDQQWKSLTSITTDTTRDLIYDAETGGGEEVFKKYPNLRKALRDNLEFYWNNKKKLKQTAPELFDNDHHAGRTVDGEREIDERMNTIQDTFDIKLTDHAQSQKDRFDQSKEPEND